MIIPLSPLQVVTAGGTLVALLVAFVALATPAWQVVYAREIEQWIQSGLWLNCQKRPTGMYTCTYTFSAADFNFYTSAELVNLRTPPFYAWQRTLLAIFLFGQLFAFLSLISLFLSFQTPTRRISALAVVAMLAITALLHSCATLAFALISQMVEYRFYQVSVSGIYEKHHGYSYYLELVALVIYFSSMPTAVVHAIRVWKEMRDQAKAYGEGSEMLGSNLDREPYSAFYPPSLSVSRHGAQHSGSTTHSILDPYETQFAMRALPEPPLSSYR